MVMGGGRAGKLGRGRGTHPQLRGIIIEMLAQLSPIFSSYYLWTIYPFHEAKYFKGHKNNILPDLIAGRRSGGLARQELVSKHRISDLQDTTTVHCFGLRSLLTTRHTQLSTYDCWQE